MGELTIRQLRKTVHVSKEYKNLYDADVINEVEYITEHKSVDRLKKLMDELGITDDASKATLYDVLYEEKDYLEVIYKISRELRIAQYIKFNERCEANLKEEAQNAVFLALFATQHNIRLENRKFHINRDIQGVIIETGDIKEAEQRIGLLGLTIMPILPSEYSGENKERDFALDEYTHTLSMLHTPYNEEEIFGTILYSEYAKKVESDLENMLVYIDNDNVIHLVTEEPCKLPRILNTLFNKSYFQDVYANLKTIQFTDCDFSDVDINEIDWTFRYTKHLEEVIIQSPINLTEEIKNEIIDSIEYCHDKDKVYIGIYE